MIKRVNRVLGLVFVLASLLVVSVKAEVVAEKKAGSVRAPFPNYEELEAKLKITKIEESEVLVSAFIKQLKRGFLGQHYSSDTLNFYLVRLKKLNEFAADKFAKELKLEIGLAYLELLFWSEEEAYEKIVLANSLWEQRDGFNKDVQLDLIQTLERVFQNLDRPHERLQVLQYQKNFLEMENMSYDTVYFLANLASVHHQLHEFDHALEAYRLTIKACERVEDNWMKISMMNNIGSLYSDQGMKDSARQAFEESLVMLEKYSNTSNRTKPRYIVHFRNVLKWNWMRSFSDKEYVEEKEKLAFQLTQTGDAEKEYHWVWTGLQYMSVLAYQSNDYLKSHQLAEKALRIAQLHLNLKKQIQSLTSMAKCNLIMGDRTNADFLFEKADKIRDSLRNSDSRKKALIDAAFMRAREKDARIDEMELKRIELEKINYEEETQIRWLWGGIFCIVIFSFGLIMFLRRIRKDKKGLGAQKQLLEQALTEKELMLKEIHHRVKNNMQIMTGLLQLQSESSKNVEFKELAREGQSRIDSMALVHKMLYLNSDFTGVELDNYFQLLIRQIVSTFPEAQNIELKLNLKKVEVNLDICISLGLILNELVTNVLKHAFDSNSINPLLVISLDSSDRLEYTLMVKDNGKGMGVISHSAESLGMQLVHMLVKEIRGTVQMKDENGLLVEVKFDPNSIN